MDLKFGLWRKLSTEKLILLNVVLEKTPESPLDWKEIQPVHPKEISPGCSLEGLMLKLKPPYFGHLMRRADSLEKPLMLGGIGGRRRRGRQRMRWLMASPTRWMWVWVNSKSLWWTGRPGMLQFIGLQLVGHDWVTELNWWTPYLWQRRQEYTMEKRQSL